MPRLCVAPGESSFVSFPVQRELTLERADVMEEHRLKSTLAEFSFGEDAARREYRLVGGRWRPDREGGMRRVWCAHCAGVGKA